MSAYTTTDNIDTLLGDYVTTAHLNDTLSTVYNKIQSDSLTLATRMDTLLSHVCDSVENCVTGWIGDTLSAYTTTDNIDTLLNGYVTNTTLADSMNKIDIRIKTDSIEVRNLYIAAMGKVQADSLTLATRMDTMLTHVCDSVKDCVNDLISDTATAIRNAIPTVNDGTLSISVNGGTPQTFTANQSGNTEVDISVPTCDDLANCDLIRDILNRLERLERVNDSLVNELDKMKPSLTVDASLDSVIVCEGSSLPVTYTATFHNCSRSDYTLSWKVNGTDSSTVTGDELTFIAENAGNYVVVCTATRSDNTSVTDSVTTKVIVDSLPSFTVTVDTLTVKLSNVKYTATVKWDTAAPVAVSGTSAEHTFTVADTITITAFSKGDCPVTFGLRLQPFPPKVTTDSIPASTITASTAIAMGTVTFDGGIPETRRGMLYFTSNQNLKLGVEGVDSVMSGKGMGSFACNLKQ